MSFEEYFRLSECFSHFDLVTLNANEELVRVYYIFFDSPDHPLRDVRFNWKTNRFINDHVSQHWFTASEVKNTLTGETRFWMNNGCITQKSDVLVLKKNIYEFKEILAQHNFTMDKPWKFPRVTVSNDGKIYIELFEITF